MASRYGITLPNGARFTLLYNTDQSKIDLLEKLILRKWSGYCLKNWLSENHAQPYAPEHKVKRLLDRCGTLLLRDVPKGERNTLTSYKEMIVGSREINASDCPEGIAQMLEGGTIGIGSVAADDRQRYVLLIEKLDARAGISQAAEAPTKRRKRETRFDRLHAIRRKYPGCAIEGCRVDVDGAFLFQGSGFRIDGACAQYAPRKTRYGDQYDMDRVIVVVLRGGGILFADQDGHMLDLEMILRYEEVVK